MKSSTKLINTGDSLLSGWEPPELEDVTVSAQDIDLDEEKLRLVELFSRLGESELNLKKTRLMSNVDVKLWRPSSIEDVLAAEMNGNDEEDEYSPLSKPKVIEWQPTEFLSKKDKNDDVEGYLPGEDGEQYGDAVDLFEQPEELFDGVQFEIGEDSEVDKDDGTGQVEPDFSNIEEINAYKEEIFIAAQMDAEALSNQLIQDAQKKAIDYLQLTYAETEVVRIQMDRESDQLWRQANVELEAIKEQAHQEGISNGYKEIESIIHASKEILEQFGIWRAGMLEKSEDAVIDMVKEMAKIIFSDGVELNQAALHDNFHRILSEARALGDLRVYVNPEDMKILDPSWKDYQVQISGQSIKIYPTEAIRRGGCYVEGQQGSIDARVENQLTAILDSLAASDDTETANQEAENATPAQFTWL